MELAAKANHALVRRGEEPLRVHELALCDVCADRARAEGLARAIREELAEHEERKRERKREQAEAKKQNTTAVDRFFSEREK